MFGQTQGSGKCFPMVFFAQRVHCRLPGDWTFVVVKDRLEGTGHGRKTLYQPLQSPYKLSSQPQKQQSPTLWAGLSA